MLPLIVIQSLKTKFSSPTIQCLNQEAAVILGYQSDELLGLPFSVICPSSGYHRITQYLGQCYQEPIKLSLLAKNQQDVQVELTASVVSVPESDSYGIALLLDVATKDVANFSQCREIESALMESEQRFRQMADMTGEWLWEQDCQGYYIYSSAAVQQILGYAPDEVLGKHYTELLTDQNSADQNLTASSHKPFFDLVNDHRHKDGHLVFTESTGLPIINAKGRLLKWRGVDRDVTAKKYFQDALIESEKRTRLIIENSTNAIVIMDSDGIITDWNRQSEKIFGWDAETAIGQYLEQLIVPPRWRGAFRQGLKLFLKTGICPWLNHLVEHVAIRRDGTEFPVELSVSQLKLGDSYIFSGFIHDITTRKAAEQQIHNSQITLAIAQSEIKIAQQIQSSLLPSAPIETECFSVSGICLPADKVGGDYFDYFYHGENGFDMVIADVSGHAIGPALFMVEARSVIRSQAATLGRPGAILETLNHFLFEDLNKADYFITAFYCRYDAAKQQLSYANAGHSPPLLFRANGKTCLRLDTDGMVLGVIKSMAFEEKQVQLMAGDLLLLYTDGLTEAENPAGEFFGVQRVRDVLYEQAGQSPQIVLNALLAALKTFCQRDLFNDDITLLVFQLR